MMDEKLLCLFDREIEGARARLAEDTIGFIKIKSERGEPLPGAPFGKGPREMLDAFLKIGAAEGLYTADYGVGVVSAAMKRGTPDLGIWLHGDVVPAGEGWRFPPYDATEYEGCVVGRGATDNKGQLAAVLGVFRIFKKLGIELRYNPAIYVGSDEEKGMADLKGMEGNPDARGFLNVCEPPRLSLVPDSGFPVGYGGKGSMRATLRAEMPLTHFSLQAGREGTPGVAEAVIKEGKVPDVVADCSVLRGEVTTVSAFSPPRHSASPDPEGNMITKLAGGLLSLDIASPTEREILTFLRDVSLDVKGEGLGIDTVHEIMGDLTVFSKSIECVEGRPELALVIRYPLGITYEEIIEGLSRAAARAGFEVVGGKSVIEPYLHDPDSAIVQGLTALTNAVTGEEKPPFTLKGGTYAHVLPNAYVFGMNGCLRPEGFPKDRGGAHGIDELVSLDRLTRAMRIYARALLYLNEIEW